MKKLSLVLLTLVSSMVFGNRSAIAQVEIVPLSKIRVEKVDQVEEDALVVVEDEKIPTVSVMFAETKDYQKGDPLTWEIVAPIIEQLREQGLTLPKNAELQPMFLSEADLFYKMLSTRMGKVFFKDLSRFPVSIDRAERYLSLPDGRKELQFIITRKGGAEFFTDMVSNQNGRETARMISSNRGNQKFDQPTGKIYLESQFVDYLTTTSALADSPGEPVDAVRPRKYD